MTRVLVVDDEIDTLNLLRTILEISGYQAFTTLNSVDAITLAEVERPDLILLDIMMPNLDGFTLCKMMRMNPLTKHLPIVFVTAYSALDLEDRRVEAGADMVLPKPIGMDTLIEAIEKASEIREQANFGPVASVAPAAIQPSTMAPVPIADPLVTTAPATPAGPTAPMPDFVSSDGTFMIGGPDPLAVPTAPTVPTTPVTEPAVPPAPVPAVPVVPSVTTAENPVAPVTPTAPATPPQPVPTPSSATPAASVIPAAPANTATTLAKTAPLKPEDGNPS